MILGGNDINILIPLNLTQFLHLKCLDDTLGFSQPPPPYFCHYIILVFSCIILMRVVPQEESNWFHKLDYQMNHFLVSMVYLEIFDGSICTKKKDFHNYILF